MYSLLRVSLYFADLFPFGSEHALKDVYSLLLQKLQKLQKLQNVIWCQEIQHIYVRL